MQRLGRVSGISGGLLLVRSPEDARPDIGAAVVDDSLATVGRVVDVIGPVRRPYAVVAPDDGPDPARLEDRVYTR